MFFKIKHCLLLAVSFAAALCASGISANAKPVVPDRRPQTAVVASTTEPALLLRSEPLDRFRPGPQARRGVMAAGRAGKTIDRRQFLPNSKDSITAGGHRRGVFGSVAIPFGKLPAATRWKAVYASIGIDHLSGCQTARTCSARQSTIVEAISRSRGQGFVEKLQTVNSSVNAMIAYVVDTRNYGQIDHWAGPVETLAKGSGDCEDFAILKMAILKAAGIPTRSMSLVVLRDRRRNLFHAVLSVATDQGHFILDNAHDVVLSDASITRYQPLFSLSENRSWIHGIKRKAGDLIASNLSYDVIAPGEGAESLGRFGLGRFD